jgi:non-ribosomal peptide synthetase component F
MHPHQRESAFPAKSRDIDALSRDCDSVRVGIISCAEAAVAAGHRQLTSVESSERLARYWSSFEWSQFFGGRFMGRHLKTAAAIFTRSPAAFVRAHLHALHSGQCSLLIPDQDHGLLREAARYCDRVTVYSDHPTDPALRGYETISVADLPTYRSIPDELAPETAVAVLFTSGSTGRAKLASKSFRNFAGEARSLDKTFRTPSDRIRVLTTLPFEHMYGYMYGFFWPRLLDLDAPDSRITLPAALTKELQLSDLPVWLVTTPLHLNAFAETGLRTDKVVRVFSATSALSPALAAHARQCFGVAVTDIYGSTETGTIASRQMPNEVDLWECIPGRSLSQCADGRVQLDCVDFSEPELLNDVLELSSPQQFRCSADRPIW